MGTGIRYTEEFKQEAVNQVVVHGYDVHIQPHKKIAFTNDIR